MFTHRFNESNSQGFNLSPKSRPDILYPGLSLKASGVSPTTCDPGTGSACGVIFQVPCHTLKFKLLSNIEKPSALEVRFRRTVLGVPRQYAWWAAPDFLLCFRHPPARSHLPGHPRPARGV